MTRPNLDPLPQFYKRYVERLRETDVLDALTDAMRELDELISTIPIELQDFAYEADKWTVRQVLCHLSDVERIMAYRALRFARNDNTPLPGFEENDYASESNPTSRSLTQLRDELKQLRLTTIDLFRSFTPAMLDRNGMANNMEFCVSNLGYIIAGHAMHHCHILQERYLNAK